MSQFDEDDLKRRFAFHPADGPTGQTHDTVRSSVHDCASDLCELIPPGRELSLALTSLEQAMMWGNAGVARAAADDRLGEGPAGGEETSVASGDAGAAASPGQGGELPS